MTPPHRLRPAIAADLDAIVSLERATANAPHWPQSAYAAILSVTDPQPTAQQRSLFVAQLDGQLAGFAAGLLHPSASQPGNRIAELETVVVAASGRRKGIGRALCYAVVEWCSLGGANEAKLEVRATSAAAIALYASLGFEQTGRRPRYYRDPDDDAIVMNLRLDRCSPEAR